jgi:alpha-beta hydrolase superfamily lysophospholipase
MKPQRVTILNNKKEKLVGYLYKGASKTIIIICHGIDPVNGFPGVEDIFALYQAAGASVYSFDFSGYGESEGESMLSVKQRDADIKAVLDYFSSRYEDIILYGVSFAGVSVAIAAAKYKYVKKLITINGFFTSNPKQLFFLQAIQIALFITSHPHLWFELLYIKKHFKPEKITVPTIIVYGEKDTIVNPKQSIRFFNKLKTEKKLLPVPDGDHPLVKKEYLKVTKAVPEWIGQHVVYT